MTRNAAISIALLAAASLWAAAAPSLAAESSWSYSGPNGPAKWGKLGKENAICGTGQLQSPIDIPDAKVRKGDIPPLLFNYKAVPISIIDTGNTIEVNYPPGSFVTVDGKRFELVSIDFHKPSESKVNGKGHDMSMHLVHKGEDGKQAIIVVFLDQGNENEIIKTLWKNLPVTKGKEVVVDGTPINALGLLPKNKDYYRFQGSLSKPPCTENVTWIVLKTPATLSGESIARFGRLYTGNVRPIQALNDRDIVGSASR